MQQHQPNQLTYIPTYLPTSISINRRPSASTQSTNQPTYLPTYLPSSISINRRPSTSTQSTYLPITYLPTYLPITYLPTYYLPTSISINRSPSASTQSTYLPTYLPRYQSIVVLQHYGCSVKPFLSTILVRLFHIDSHMLAKHRGLIAPIL